MVPVPLSRLQPSRIDAIEDWPWLAHQGALIGAGMEGDAPADPALEHIVENLDLGHGHNGGGPDPDAVPRKGWPGSNAVATQGQSGPVAASSWNPCLQAQPPGGSEYLGSALASGFPIADAELQVGHGSSPTRCSTSSANGSSGCRGYPG
jgi:hypothetical protein